MTRRSRIIWAAVILLIAYLAQRLWMSELNFFVWKITYIGEQVAFLLAPPNYDSAASTGIFQALAILINAVVYGAVLWLLRMLWNRWRPRRAVRR